MDRPQRTGNEPYPREHYERVAVIWLEEWVRKQGRREPTLKVAQAFDVQYTTAARWVMRARQLGVLEQRFKRVHVCPGCGVRIECPRGEV